MTKSKLPFGYIEVKFHTSTSWRVLSTREGCNSAGYWTSSYIEREDALSHQRRLLEAEGGGAVDCFEVTSEFMYENNKIVARVSEKWRLLK